MKTKILGRGNPLWLPDYKGRHTGLPLLIITILLSFIISANASSKKPAKTPDFAGSPAWMKMDLRLREAWKKADTDRTNSTRFECIMKTSHPMSADEKVILKDKDFEYRILGMGSPKIFLISSALPIAPP